MISSKEIVGMMIKQRRLLRTFSQQDLADLLDVDRQYIWRLEHGKINLTMNYLDKIVAVLGCLHTDFFQLPGM